MRDFRVVVFAGAFLLVTLGAMGRAWGKRVVVTGFAGPGGAKVRDYVERVVSRDHELVSLRRFSRTARRLGIRRLKGARNVRRVCRRLGVDAVIYGRVVRRRGRWWFRIYVREGRTGRVVKREVIRLRGPRLDGRSRYDIRYFVRKAVRRARGPVVVESEESTGSEATSTEESAPSRPEPEKKVKKRTHLPPGSRHNSFLTAVEAGLLLDVVGRKFTIYPEKDNPDYRTQGVIPPVGFWAEVFPMAFMTTKVGLSDFGFGFWWTRSFGVTSDAGPAGSGFATTYQKIELYATYRWNFLRKPMSPEIRVDLGFANQEFSIDAPEGSGDQVMSVGVNYWCFMPRLRARFPVVRERLAFLVQFAYFHPFQFGDTAEPWAYGKTKGWGLEVHGGLDVRLLNFVYLRILGRYSYFSLTYTKADSHAFTADNATDHYYGIVVGLGVKYSHFVPKNFF